MRVRVHPSTVGPWWVWEFWLPEGEDGVFVIDRGRARTEDAAWLSAIAHLPVFA